MDEIDDALTHQFEQWLAAAPIIDPATVSMSANLTMADCYERAVGFLQARQVRHLARIATHPDPVPAPATPTARQQADRDRYAQLSATQEVAVCCAGRPATPSAACSTPPGS